MAVHKARLVPHLFTLASFVALNYAFALHAPEPTLKAVPHRNETELDKRTGIITELSTCGYLNGDPSKSRTADSGYNCRIDTRNGLWGFCPTTVVAARDCGLAGSCVDEHRCSQGCGFTDQRSLTTFTCETKRYCSTALLTFGPDQTYSYLACGAGPSTDHYLVSPTAEATTTSTKQATKSTSTSVVPLTTPSTTPSTTIPSTTTPSATTPSTTTPSATTPSTTTPSATASVSPSSTQSGVGSSSPSSTLASLVSESTSVSPAANSSSGGQPNNTGAIVGGVVGGLALICGSGIAAIYLLRRHRAPPGPQQQGGLSAAVAAEPKYASSNLPVAPIPPAELPS